MNLKGTSIVFRKELKDLFRDKKTVIVGILIPLLIYPLMYGLMGKASESNNKKVENSLKIAVADSGNSSLGNYIKAQKNVVIINSKDMKKDVQDGNIYVGIDIPNDFEAKMKNETTLGIRLVYDDTSQTSELAANKVNSIINDYSKEIVKRRLIERKIDISIITPFDVRQETAAKEKGGLAKMILSILLPMTLILYALTGAMPAAIDLGAGEKERGTLEPLLTTQASRMNLLFGKLFAITLMGLIGTISSMIGLAISFKVSSGMFGGDMAMMLPPKAIILMGLATLLLTMIFGAVELSISIYARSFKEASTYLSPFSIIGMVAVFGTMYMDVKDVPVILLNVPITNVSIIMKEFIAGIYNPLHIGLTFGWTFVYIIGAILFARYMFSREEVIFRT